MTVPRTTIRVDELLKESLRSARSHAVPTALVALIVAAMCATTLLTVGRTIAAQRVVEARLEAAGSRHLVVADTTGVNLPVSVVALAAQFDSVAAVLGFGDATDVRSASVGAGGAAVTAWPTAGALPRASTLLAGRWPRPGEAVISQDAADKLSLRGPVGAVQDALGRQYAVVGIYAARPGFDRYASGVLVASDGPHVRRYELLATTAGNAAGVQTLVLGMLARSDPRSISVESPTALAEIQAQVTGDVGSFGNNLTLLVLGVGAVLAASVVWSDVLIRRRDLGRRRALGATRGTIVALVVTRTVAAGAAGAVVGSAAAIAILATDHSIPSIDFTAATAMLVLITTALSAAVPAVGAARRDPVRVLRTP